MKADVQKIYDDAYEGAVAKLKTAIDKPGELLQLVSQMGERFTKFAQKMQAEAAEDLQTFIADRPDDFEAHQKARAALRDGLNPKPKLVDVSGGVIKSKKVS